MHDVVDLRAGLRSGRVGSVLFRDGAGSLAERRRAIGCRAAIDHLVHHHPASAQAAEAAAETGLALTAWLASEAQGRNGAPAIPGVAGDLVVVREFLGNRSPFADPDARGIVAGIGMDSSLESLIGWYLAGLCGIAYGARQIIQALADNGVPIDTIVVSGGAATNALVRQVLADATGLPVCVSTSAEPVLLGSAMLGAVAGRVHGDIADAMENMSSIGDAQKPIDETRTWHDKHFDAFLLLQQTGRMLRKGA